MSSRKHPKWVFGSIWYTHKSKKLNNAMASMDVDIKDHETVAIPVSPQAISATIPSQNDLINAQRELLKTGQFSDFTTSCGEHTRKVHRAIIAPRCSFFAAICKDDDSSFNEGKKREVVMNEDPILGIDLMLDYLYTCELPKFSMHDNDAWDRASGAFRVGDKYGPPIIAQAGLQALKDLLRAANWMKEFEDDPQKAQKDVRSFWSFTKHHVRDERAQELRQALVDAFRTQSWGLKTNDAFLELIEGDEELRMMFELNTLTE